MCCLAQLGHMCPVQDHSVAVCIRELGSAERPSTLRCVLGDWRCGLEAEFRYVNRRGAGDVQN